RLYLPSALGLDETDHLLPATLALLADTTGDLVSYGWRLGTGTGRAWRHAHELRERMLDAARIALLGYEGPLMTTALGPATLAEGLGDRRGGMAERVPGARQHVLLREDAVAAVHEGRIPTPSGRRRYDPVPAPEIGTLWRILMVALEEYGLGPDSVTVGVGADLRLLRAAREAGIRRMAIAPRRLPPLSTEAGRALWEGIAEACDDGAVLEIVVDPRPGGNLGPELEMMLETWRRLGHSDADAAGVAVIAHTGASHDLHSGRVDPS